MKLNELNEILRSLILNKIENGWIKSQIGKILLGPSGQAQMNRFLSPNESGIKINFGIKPLQKIARLLDYDATIIFIPNNKSEINQAVEECNMRFLSELSIALDNFIKNNFTENIIKNNSKSEMDEIINSIIEEEIK